MPTKKSTTKKLTKPTKKPSKPLTTKIKKNERPINYDLGIPFWTKSH
jgi:hypothetical protein